MLVILIVTFIFIITDLLFTRRWISLYGMDAEGNPIGRWILSSKFRTVIFKIIVPICALSVLYIFRSHRAAVIGSIIVLSVYSVIVLIHHIILFKTSGNKKQGK